MRFSLICRDFLFESQIYVFGDTEDADGYIKRTSSDDGEGSCGVFLRHKVLNFCGRHSIIREEEDISRTIKNRNKYYHL